MRPRLLALPFLLAAAPAGTPARAHGGHWGDVAGHDHWVAGAAVGAAVLAGLWGAWKGRKEAESGDPDEADRTAGREGEAEA